MIIFFGPAGSGKSVQGHILAARQGWRWLSMGRLLRETGDKDILGAILEGELIDNQKANDIMGVALKNAVGVNQVIVEGWPRALEQAQWLVANQSKFETSVDLAIVLDVPTSELMRRLAIRGRSDDMPEAIEERLSIYAREVSPILHYFTENNIPVVHIDGSGSVGQIHDLVVEELTGRGLA